MKNVDIEVGNQIYKKAREQADLEMGRLKESIEGIKAEQFLCGVLSKIKYDDSHNRLLKYALLYQYKQKKEYIKGGMNWEQVCEHFGEDRSNISEIFKDLKPLFDELAGNFHALAGIPFNKIRYLGKSKTGDSPVLVGDCLVIGDEEIPLAHKDEIEAAIDAMKDAHKSELSEMELMLRSKDRNLDAKNDVIKKQEKEIAKHEKRLQETKMAPGEEAFLKQLADTKALFDLIESKLHIDVIDLSEASPRMKAEYIATLEYIAHITDELYINARDAYGTGVSGVHDDGYVFPAQRKTDESNSN